MDDHELTDAGREVLGRAEDVAGDPNGALATQIDNQLDQAAGKLEGQFASTVEDLTRKASEIVGRAGRVARDATHTVRLAAESVREKVYKAGAQAGGYVGQTIEKQPLLSLIGVAAFGYIIAFFIHSPSSPLTPPPPKHGFFR
jgi:hypothetical protein